MGTYDGVRYNELWNFWLFGFILLNWKLQIFYLEYMIFRRFSRNRDRTIWNTMGNIASRSGNKHLYAFITSSKGSVMGGWANINALCGPTTHAVSISRYYQRNVIFTARVKINFEENMLQYVILMKSTWNHWLSFSAYCSWAWTQFRDAPWFHWK